MLIQKLSEAWSHAVAPVTWQSSGTPADLGPESRAAHRRFSRPETQRPRIVYSAAWLGALGPWPCGAQAARLKLWRGDLWPLVHGREA
jgi:hypothetical protein